MDDQQLRAAAASPVPKTATAANRVESERALPLV